MQQALINLGYDFGSYGADGDFGSVTEKAVKAFQAKVGVEQTGKYDAKTHAALMVALSQNGSGGISAPAITGKQVEVTGSSVNIRKGHGTQYDRITTKNAGVQMEYVATAANGWNAVVVGNQVGWISGLYSKVI